MAALVTVPLEEYLRTSYSPDCEWVDGEVRERNMGDRPHASVQAFFIRYFGSRESDLQINAFPELRLQVTARNYRVPDVMLVRKSDPVDDVVTVAPLLCIEVVSPDDSLSDMYGKVDDYLAMGVPVVWVVDPRRRTGRMSVGADLIKVEELVVPGTAIRVTMKEVLEDLDQHVQRRSS